MRIFMILAVTYLTLAGCEETKNEIEAEQARYEVRTTPSAEAVAELAEWQPAAGEIEAAADLAGATCADARANIVRMMTAEGERDTEKLAAAIFARCEAMWPQTLIDCFTTVASRKTMGPCMREHRATMAAAKAEKH